MSGAETNYSPGQDPEVGPADFGVGRLFWEIRDAVVVADAATERILLWNPAAEVIFGYTSEEAVRLPLHALVPDRLRDQHRHGLANYARTGRGQLIDSRRHVELPALHKDGHEISVSFSLTPLGESATPGRYVLAVVRDVSEQKALQRELIAKHSELEKAFSTEKEAADRLRVLDQVRNDFVAMIVHDLRSPITALASSLHVLKRGWDDLPPEEKSSILDAMIDSTGRLSRLAEDVLLVSRLETGQFSYSISPFELQPVIQAAVDRHSATTEQLDFEISLPSDLPQAVADRDRQEQILDNLLSNASKFAPANSSVSVEATPSGRYIEVAVADRGPGIGRNDHERVFQKFSRLDHPERGAPGTGLGLYICKTMVEGQGGSIWVESEEGAGATFKYTVPAAG